MPKYYPGLRDILPYYPGLRDILPSPSVIFWHITWTRPHYNINIKVETVCIFFRFLHLKPSPFILPIDIISLPYWQCYNILIEIRSIIVHLVLVLGVLCVTYHVYIYNEYCYLCFCIGNLLSFFHYLLTLCN